MTRRLLLLNGLAAAGAVIYHATGWGFTCLFWWTDRYRAVTVPDFSQVGGVAYYSLRVLEQLVTFSLPAFLFVSGYFVAFAAGRDGTVGWGKVRGRVRMLLIPYVLWSLAIFAARALEGTVDTPGGYARQLLFGRAATPYYYVPVIAQLYLLSPFIVRAVRAYGWRVLLATAAVQVTIEAARYPMLLGASVPWAKWVWWHAPSWFFPHMAFWFVLGTFAGLNGSAFRQWVGRVKPLLPWCALAFGIVALIEWEMLQRLSSKPWLDQTPTVVDSFFSGAFILAFLAHGDARIPGRRYWDALGERSFGVYLMHAPVLELVSRALYLAGPIVLAHQIVFQSVLVAVGVGVPLLVMAAVNRSPARPAYNYLFG